MSSLVDIAEDDTPGNLTSLESDLAASVTANNATESTVAPAVVKTESSKLPEKLRGKTLEDVAEMYVNLERSWGTMANDLGTQRKLTDRLLDLKRSEDLGKQAPAKVEISTSEFLERPTETLEKFVSARDQANKDEHDARLARLEGSLAQQRFEQKHSDSVTLANDPAFVSWVQKSSFRVKAAQAAYGGDWTVADELLTEYKKETGTVANATAPVVTEDKGNEGLKAARAASLDTSGTSSEGTDTKTSGKVYRRSDLIKLRIEKPDAYYDEGFQAVIMQAHKEGRVK